MSGFFLEGCGYNEKHVMLWHLDKHKVCKSIHPPPPPHGEKKGVVVRSDVYSSVGLFRRKLAFSSSLCNVLAGSGREKKFPDLQSQICSDLTQKTDEQTWRVSILCTVHHNHNLLFSQRCLTTTVNKVNLKAKIGGIFSVQLVLSPRWRVIEEQMTMDSSRAQATDKRNNGLGGIHGYMAVHISF